MKAPARQRGAAILAALVTVALVAGLSVAAFWRQWRGIEVETAGRQALQAEWLLAGALEWARGRVGEDGLRSPALDHPGEAWAQPVQGLPLQAFWAAGQSSPGQAPKNIGDTGPRTAADEARLSLVIEDAQGRLNLLNLLEGQAISPTWLAVFRRLFERLGLPPQQLELLAEQLRLANLGTTDAPPPARLPLVPMRQADLAWMGLTPATVDALQAHVSLLPGRLPVNLNTAGPEVLGALLALEPAQVQQLVARRQAQPFASLAATGLARTDEQMQSVNSHFFEVQAELQLGRQAPVTLREHALLQRDGRDVRTLWQRRETPRPAAPASAAPKP